jgi:hypothetical protein
MASQGWHRCVAVAAVLLVGCEPSFEMRGDVVDAQGEPVANADVVLTCKGVDQRGARTNSSGRFRDAGIGAYGEPCTIEVRRSGKPSVSFSVMANCVRTADAESCVQITLHAKVP